VGIELRVQIGISGLGHPEGEAVRYRFCITVSRLNEIDIIPVEYSATGMKSRARQPLTGGSVKSDAFTSDAGYPTAIGTPSNLT
jgi:hypothetical protein